MYTALAQGALLEVDSSYFETPPGRNPFSPQVPQQTQELAPVAPIRPVIVEEPQAEIEPLESIVMEHQEPAEESTASPIEEEAPDLTISGLVWNTDRPQAIVNEEVVGIGDAVAGVHIVDIRRGQITILRHGKTMTIEYKY